jgi:hypothetical protein
MRPIELDMDLATENLTGLASNIDSSGTTLTFDGTLISGGTFTSSDGLGRIIVIVDSDTDTKSDVTFTITGTDSDGNAITDVVTGPASAATVASAKYFKTVSSVSVSAAQGGTEKVDIGIRGTTLAAASRSVPLDWRCPVAATVDVDVTGTLNFTVQQTFDDLLTSTNASGNIVWQDVTALASKTADTTASLTVGARGMRVIINTYSTGAELQAVIIQPGMYD